MLYQLVRNLSSSTERWFIQTLDGCVSLEKLVLAYHLLQRNVNKSIQYMSSHQGLGVGGWTENEKKNWTLSSCAMEHWTRWEVAAVPHFYAVRLWQCSTLTSIGSVPCSYTLFSGGHGWKCFVIGIKIASKINAIFLLLIFKRLIIHSVYYISKTKKNA